MKLQEKVNELKQELIKHLKTQDLTGTTIWVRDFISNSTGGSVDHEIGGMNSRLTIEDHDGDEIVLTDDCDEEVGTFNLQDFGLEFLMEIQSRL